MAKRWLVIGLGNPGISYERTRHNAGFAVLALLAMRHGARFRRNWPGGRSESAQIQLGAAPVLLLRPLTFMNLSGEAVRPVLRKAGYAPSEVILVYDDMDVPFGRLRLRPGGSAGGHRGVASVLAAFGDEGLGRVRIGIGRPDEGTDAAEYVLTAVGPMERPGWETCLQRAGDAVEAICTSGLEDAMARFNRPGA